MSINWEDLRYILAVEREGTLLAAAKRLKVSPTTVSRRLKELEDTQGTALFEKLKNGAVLTPAGERMIEVAEAIDRLTHELDAEIVGLDGKHEGVVRVTSTDQLLGHWLPDLGRFREQHPKIALELVSGIEIADMTQREADVAIRIGPSAAPHLIGRSYGHVAMAIYGSRELVDGVGADAPYSSFDFLGLIPQHMDSWVKTHASGASVVLRCSRMALLVRATLAGHGLAMLPCVVGDSHPDLLRVGSWMSGKTPIWVLTHPRLRGAARIRSVMALFRSLIERDGDLLAGQRPKR